MALMIWLKPGEQVMLNGALIENPNDGKVRIQINNQVRMLRQRDYLAPSADLTCAERVYVEAMRLSGGAPEASLARLLDSVAAYKGEEGRLDGDSAVVDKALKDIISLGADGEFYLAMVEARTLIALENSNHPVLPRTQPD